MRGTQETIAVLMAAVLTVSIIGMVTVLGAGSAAAIHPDGQDMSEHANYTVNFPYATDHYPGDQNQENGSIEYFSTGEDAFAEQDAEEGIYMHYIAVHAEHDGEDWIDYSACSTENTKAFGIDRGSDNEGTNYDEDLVTHRKDGEFLDNGLTVVFYDWEDVPEDPPYLAPEDAVVAAQGAGSPAGPCLTLTSEPGWYRIATYANGTVADNGQGEQPSENAKEIEFVLKSNYLYVCECDSEEEAREQLGPPPNEDGGGDDGGETTPTEGGDDGGDGQATETEGGDDGQATETEGGDDGQATETEGGDDGQATETEGGDDGQDDGDQPVVEDDEEGTPGSDDQPGFGAVAALVALLASALLLYRRD